jgi:hypothetical protein
VNYKKWGWFRVNAIQEVQFDENASDSLIFQENFKQMFFN